MCGHPSTLTAPRWPRIDGTKTWHVSKTALSSSFFFGSPPLPVFPFAVVKRGIFPNNNNGSFIRFFFPRFCSASRCVFRPVFNSPLPFFPGPPLFRAAFFPSTGFTRLLKCSPAWPWTNRLSSFLLSLLDFPPVLGPHAFFLA